MRKLIIPAAIAIIAAAGLGYFVLGNDSDEASTGWDIETSKVERGDVARIVSASGSVRALTTVEVGSQVSGQITELMADFNSQVTANQIIARIDPQTFETRVASSRADVASASASLEVQQASIVRAQANLDNVEKDYARQAALYEQDAIALSLLEDKQRELAVAKADLEVARAQLKTSQASLSQRRASLQSSLVDLERTIIRSPIDGVVIERNVDAGQTVQASFSAPTIFLIAQDLGDIRIDASVVEGDIGGINTGDPAIFKVDAYPEETFEGVVEQVRLASETIANVVTYTVVIAAQNPTARLLPGMTANVEITAEKRPDVLRVADSTTRFRPPLDGPEVLEAEGGDGEGRGQRGEGREGGQGGGNQADTLLAGLEIDDATKAIVSEKLTAELTRLRASFTQTAGADAGGGMGGADRTAQRQRFQTAINQVLRENLSAAQYRAYQQKQNATTAQRFVELYKSAEDGKLTTQRLGVGLSDGSYIEILRGAEEGDEFITRLRPKASE